MLTQFIMSVKVMKMNKLSNDCGGNIITRSRAEYYWAMILIFLGGMTAYSMKHGPQPLIPFISIDYGLTPAAGSLVVASEMLGMSVTLLGMVIYADYFPRRKTTGLALLLSGILALMAGVTPSYPIIVAARFAQGMILGAFPALLVDYINEEFEETQAAFFLGIYFASTAAGGMLGRMETILISSFMGWREAFYFLGFLGIAVSLFYMRKLPVERSVRKHTRHISVRVIWQAISGSRDLHALCFMGMVFMGSFAVIYTYITFVLLDVPYQFTRQELAPIFLMQIFGCFSSSVTGKVLKWQRWRLFLSGHIALMAAGILMTGGTGVIWKFTGLAVFMIGMFGAQTTAVHWVSLLKDVPRAGASSLYLFSYYTGGSLFSVTGGFFYHFYGWNGIMAFLLVAMGLALIAYLYLYRRWEQACRVSCKKEAVKK